MCRLSLNACSEATRSSAFLLRRIYVAEGTLNPSMDLMDLRITASERNCLSQLLLCRSAIPRLKLLPMISRRSLISSLSMLGAASGLSFCYASAQTDPDSPDSFSETIPLRNGWQFRLDPSASLQPVVVAASDADWQPVTVPHTWQAMGGSPDYAGVAWYRRSLLAPEEWRTMFVRIEFEAAYHTAHVFLNGAQVGQHIGKGYTAFTCDLSPHLQYGTSNELVVRVDNSISDTTLPRMKSFDWANDGGLIRPVQLLVTPQLFTERLEIDAFPDLDSHRAEISVRAIIRNTTSSPQTAKVWFRVRAEGMPEAEYTSIVGDITLAPSSNEKIAVGAIQIESPKLWHFDSPNLYRAEVALEGGGRTHVLGDWFGIRKFEIRGTSFYLNGERVSLIGVERMAGSNPQYGMAEPADWIDSNSRDMKDLNCVFTRVHWPQDKRVLEACDRLGILIQEEVPAWGSFTFDNISHELESQLTANGLGQLREMAERDRNHPCIVSWGLCNEVNGKNPITRRFAHALADEAHKIDSSRLLTYASNSLQVDPGQDMAGDFDFVSINEYFGTWSPGSVPDARGYLNRIRKAFPGKPLVISEYGYCECRPEFATGDEHRVKIIEGHTELYREFPEIAGAIYFDYNDYRTQMGDKGAGAFLQRVHGVVDLFGARKPSFDALGQQSSPIKSLVLNSTGKRITAQIETRSDLPSYTLHGYSVRWIFYGYDDLPMGGSLQALAPLAPGASITVHTSAVSIPYMKRVRVDIRRPTGFSVKSVEMIL